MFNINSVINRTLIYFPIFKIIISNIKFIEKNSVNTACTNCNTIYYNSDFFQTISLDEQVSVIAHELMHITLKHISRMEDRDIEIWNYATDAVINQIIKKNGLPLVEGVIDCPDALDYSAEEYYEMVKNRPDCDELMSKYRHAKEESFVASHDKWDSKEEEEVTEDIPNITEHNITDVNKKLVHDENQDIRDGLGRGAIGSDSKKIDTVGSSAPVIDWKTFLQRKKKKIVSTDYNLHQGEFDEEGIYKYPFELIRKANIEILIDTSGSVDDELVKAFLRECKNIFDDFEIKIGCFDTEFYGFHSIKDKEELDSFTIEGRGGTDFDVAVKSFSKKASLKIIFTDGYDNVSVDSNDVIWIVYGNTNFKPPGGIVFFVDPYSLKLQGRTR
jgi:predicted metal-dependent peptidase